MINQQLQHGGGANQGANIGQGGGQQPNQQGLRMPGSSENMGYGQRPNQNVNIPQQQNPHHQGQQQQFNQPQQQFVQPQQPQMQLSQEMLALSNNPQFQMMRSQVQANPNYLQMFLEQIRQSNPAMFNLINNHQQEFI